MLGFILVTRLQETPQSIGEIQRKKVRMTVGRSRKDSPPLQKTEKTVQSKE